jgi:hypothetical protein
MAGQKPITFIAGWNDHCQPLAWTKTVELSRTAGQVKELRSPGR